jgi:hypothetical protein
MTSKYAKSLVLMSAIVGVLAFSAADTQVVARDPGVRGGAAGAGGPIPGLTANQREFFELGLEDFLEDEEVDEGLGPRFNFTGCGGCHKQPDIGGSSPAANPQFDVVRDFHQTAPSFISPTGPVREARFVKNPDGSPDGGVHALFVIAGHPDAAGCTIQQENFAAQVANQNVRFRIPTPVFGMGLVESIEDGTLRANIAANNAQKVSLGIFGKFNVSGAANTNGNDGTITRFGWKAQNKSGLLFAGEAYNVEMGITNEIFQTEREENAACQFANAPNDEQNTDSVDEATPAAAAFAATTAIQNFANFQRFSAPPAPVTSYTGINGSVSSTSIARGRQRFVDVGCHLCHTPTLMTSSKAKIAALRGKQVNAFSDFAVHGMGPGLADSIAQGAARGDEFRSAPLWGLGQRIFFLHDGRTTDLRTAIVAHKSSGNSQFGPSEANAVVDRFNLLNGPDTQDLFNFLRSL